MAKKGKQKVTVEEVDDDGLNMIGDLFGEQDDWANPRQDNSHDPWSVNPGDSASNAHTNTAWGAGTGGAGGRQTGRSRSNATAAMSAYGQNHSTIHPQQLQQLLHEAQAQARGRQPEKAKKNDAQWKSGGAGGKNVGWNTTWEAGGGGGKGGGKGGSGRGGAYDSGWGGGADSGWGTHTKEAAWGGGGDDGGWGTAGDQNGEWDTGNDAGGWGNNEDSGWGAEQTGDWNSPADNWGGGEENDWTQTAPTPQYSQHGHNWEGAHRSKTPKEHNQIFSAFFGKNKSGNAQPSGKTQDQKGGGGKKGKKKKNQQQQSKLPPMAEVDEYEMVSGDPVHDYWNSNAGTSWYGPTYTMPSKTFAHATDGRPSPHSKGSGSSPYLETQFVSSHGEALTLAQKALYSKERLARNRIHWMFNPEKDDRVAGLLEWIQTMSYQLAAFGLNSFLQTRERGALISNADYRPWESPQEPAFDWINFDEVQATKDRTLQESLAFYDPSAIVLVFVFLLSPTGNSMAIWRRKLVIPNNLRLTFGREISQAKAGLRRQYPIHVDEMPVNDMSKSRAKIESDAQPKRKLSKRKWLRWL